jgi:hypothetical protein
MHVLFVNSGILGHRAVAERYSKRTPPLIEA